MCPHYRQVLNTDFGVQLHSRYNPQAEAERYINSLDLKKNIECFILIEPGKGFIIPVLREKFPKSKIIVLHVDNSFMTNDFNTSNLAVWYGSEAFCAENSETQALHNFLDKEIPEIDISQIKIIEWRPSLNHYREAYVKLLSLIVEFLKRTDAEKRTTAAFGKRWIKNFFRNLEIIKKTIIYKTTDMPVIVAGSGPSLETALPLIKKMRESCILLAASSSVMALSNAGINADIVIATDGGNWALRHIYPLYRNICESNTALAVNLCAALPSQCSGTPFLLLNDGSFWQSIILHELELPSVIIPQRGTVTASAVDIAVLLSSGNVYLAGMDLSVRDIRSHARPYGFDSIFLNHACRFTPFYSESFIRSNQINNGGSLKIYAQWFKNQLNLWPKRIFSIGSSHEIFEDAFLFTESKCSPAHAADNFKTIPVKEDKDDLKKRGAAALISALDNQEYTANLKTELIPLLFSGEKEVTDSKLKAAIKEACNG